jgi:large subunit ribosomal protein L4
MAVQTFTKTGAKATTSAQLPKGIFDLKVENFELLKVTYNAYLDNGRSNNARTKTRTDVSGGGKKPWKQKGTGRARAGSIRSPIWKGGGVVFGPSGNENYSKRISTTAKRTAIKQALSIAFAGGKVSVIEAFEPKEAKTQAAVEILNKVGATRRTLVVVANKTETVARSTNNISDTKLVGAKYLNVFDVMNADTIIVEKAALVVIEAWLNGGAN